MRVALVIERLDRHGGGQERWTWDFAHALDARGHAVSVLTFKTLTQPDRPSIRVIEMPWHASRMVRARTAEDAVARLAPDLSHDMGVCTRATILHPHSGSRLANECRGHQSRSPLHRIASAVDPRRWIWLRELRQCEEARYPPPKGSVVIAVSRLVAQDLAKIHSVPERCIRLIPNGVDVARFAALPDADRQELRRRRGLQDRTVFLFSAHNPRLKGLLPLLSACARARSRHPALTLVVIGRPPDAETTRTVRRLRLQGAVRFDGPVQDPVPHYQSADVFVLPTWHDACSLTVLEACACGLPVITTGANGAADLLTDGQEGRIIGSARDVDALSAALEELSCPHVRSRMRIHAMKTAASNGFAQNVDLIERVYQEVARCSHSHDAVPGGRP